MSDPLPRPFNINALNSADLKKFLEENDIDTYVCKFFSGEICDIATKNTCT